MSTWPRRVGIIALCCLALACTRVRPLPFEVLTVEELQDLDEIIPLPDEALYTDDELVDDLDPQRLGAIAPLLRTAPDEVRDPRSVRMGPAWLHDENLRQFQALNGRF